ncbi:putative GATA transcription factor 22 [Spatholobus suberectus]|nr:putative GATA transcription factor 22 [Spatholobus suberectus]
MTPYSLNPPGPASTQGQTQLFISPNNQDCRTFFNIFDPRQTIEIGGLRENYYQQDDKMVLHDGSSSNCNSSFISSEPVVMDDPSSACELNLPSCRMEEEEEGESKNGHGSGKWMSSKMRLMKKMMRPSSSSTTDKAINPSPIRFQNQGHESRYSQRSHRNNSSSTTRVCSDCNTSSTPLWRSGPKGPKSLCNACGIRQRKARRAMAEAANGLVTPINAACAKTRVYNKEKKCRTNHFAQFKNKYKSTTTAGSSEGVKKLEYFNDFALSLRSNSSFQQVFPRDEVAEAAMLLMDLSCGFVHL